MDPDLRRIGHSRLRQRANFTLFTSPALANESYRRFLQSEGLSFADRASYLAYAPLGELEKAEPRLVQVVEMRYFVGLPD